MLICESELKLDVADVIIKDEPVVHLGGGGGGGGTLLVIPRRCFLSMSSTICQKPMNDIFLFDMNMTSLRVFSGYMKKGDIILTSERKITKK